MSVELEKSCRCCGRSFRWRKKWKDCWADVMYCSRSCSSQYSKSLHKSVGDKIVFLLEQRKASICPSEVSQKLFPSNWRENMELVRSVARKLAKTGYILITQKNKTVDPDSFSGPIRLKLVK